LIDYFPDDFLLFIDESHVTLPQLRAMYAGDRSRKQNLIDYGFRLPSAFDNRPLKFEEFEGKVDQLLFVSATPSEYEKKHSAVTAEQIIRPTGLMDPVVIIKPVAGQIDDLFGEINKTVEKGFRVLITTLTKRMAEDLTKYFTELRVNVTYMHSDIDTMERMRIIRDLRLGEVDVLVGINLLREGLDIPEVALVAILDADKEGFLRSETSLIQTIGRAARNSESRVILYADRITKSMEKAMAETERRRKIQAEYNTEHDITPTTIVKDIRSVLEITQIADEITEFESLEDAVKYNKDNLEKTIKKLEMDMYKASKELEFEKAAYIRDEIAKLRKELIRNSKG
ncbi:MAG TPA: helicase-related protein, partial [Bacteroidales bacterium]|nr:helicase-related protein [Bacteroidales bacterium]